tara:strand:+ start:386 stop:1054 length:669 start_codon:yes stop_codon:yes gene_type:complete
MKKTINLLLVDDHPSVIEAYSNFLSQYEILNPSYKANILTAMCCDSAIDIIERTEAIEVAFIDMRLPTSKEGNYSSGEDLCVLLKKTFPKIKIVIITGHYETLILSNILQSVNPDSMLIKGDIEAKIIFDALTRVLNNEPYYSLSVLSLLRKNLASNNFLEPIDKKMLYELWKGTKTKDLVHHLPLSMGAIEKRKRNLKLRVGAKSKDDNMLVNLVLKQGFH